MVQLKLTDLSSCVGKTLAGHTHSKDEQELLLVWKDGTMSCLEASGDEDYSTISERVYVEASWFGIHDLITAGVWPEYIRQLSEEIENAAAITAASIERDEKELYARLKVKFEPSK